MDLPTPSVRRVMLLVCVALLGAFHAPGLSAQADIQAPHSGVGPVRATWLGSAPPPAFLVQPAQPEAVLRMGSASTSKRASALLLIGAGVGMIYGGRELQDAIGFPGAVVRYTGIASTALGALFACGCL